MSGEKVYTRHATSTCRVRQSQPGTQPFDHSWLADLSGPRSGKVYCSCNPTRSLLTILSASGPAVAGGGGGGSGACGCYEGAGAAAAAVARRGSPLAAAGECRWHRDRAARRSTVRRAAISFVGDSEIVGSRAAA